MDYETLLYEADDAIATITLNRPDRLNTIVPPMPDELEGAVHRAVADEAVKVIVLRGAGRAFCARDLPGARMVRRRRQRSRALRRPRDRLRRRPHRHAVLACVGGAT